MNKITFITYHNWRTRRHGGFHQFAEYTCKQGIETIFFSFSRPYYIIFKNEERLNYNIFKLLKKGVSYKVGTVNLTNITWPTFALPGFLRKFIPLKANKWLMIHSLTSFDKIAKKWLDKTDCFVFESCDAVLLLDTVKKHYPNAQIIYRPSDPLIDFCNEEYLIEAEKRMIATANKILLVNNESQALYKEVYKEVYEEGKFHVVSNGVSVSEYLKKYSSPDELKGRKTALYIGSFTVDWRLIIEAAKQLTDIYFIIITPHKLTKETQLLVENISNIIYIPGIPPTEVPRWITNANIILQPFPANFGHYNKKSLGLTAKNYKAMAAQKPIITHMTPMHLSKYGLITTDTYQGFIDAIAENISKKTVEYNIDINEKSWDKLCKCFIQILEE